MSTGVYKGNLNVLGHESLNVWAPKLTVRPEVEAFGPAGIISDKRRTIPVDPVTGDFQVTLFPSPELRGADGRDGVRYILELALFDESFDGNSRLIAHDVWVFTAIVGGGEIKNMGSAPPNALIVGPPWPASPRPGVYFDVTSGDLGYYGIGVV